MKSTRFFALAGLLCALLPAPLNAQNALDAIANDIGSRHSGTESFDLDLWHGGYDKTNWEIVIGYVNKSWICTYEGHGTYREDFFGDSDDKFFHGIQIGGLFTPSFDWGLGLRTGLMFEAYQSHSKWITSFCNNFSEGDMYIPLHASYRIPFDDQISLNIFGGMGFQWAMSGRYTRIVGTARPGGWWWRRPIPIAQTVNHEYGNGWPQKVNWQAECGLNFHFKAFAVNFSYSFGLVDHGIENTFDEGVTYVRATRSRQDKMQASIAFDF